MTTVMSLSKNAWKSRPKYVPFLVVFSDIVYVLYVVLFIY